MLLEPVKYLARDMRKIRSPRDTDRCNGYSLALLHCGMITVEDHRTNFRKLAEIHANLLDKEEGE